MKKFTELLEAVSFYINEGKNDYKTTKDWINSLTLDIRSPKGMKDTQKFLKHVKKIFQIDDDFNGGKPRPDSESQIKNIMDRFSPNEIDKINNKFGASEEKPLVIKKGNVTYTKADASAYTKFEKAVKDISKFLGTLKGYHKKPTKKLRIRFVKKTELRGKAVYKTELDELWVNLQSMGKTTDDYGSLVYVILHELAHRYLRKVKKQSWDIDNYKWVTTKYSKVDSWNGEEKFAELFALSNWKNKYKQYKNKIDEFNKSIE